LTILLEIFSVYVAFAVFNHLLTELCPRAWN